MESILIRKRLAAFAVLLGLGAGGVPVFAQQTGPALIVAVVTQTAELKSTRKKRRKLQERIIATEATITVTLDRVHGVEDGVLGYLSDAQGAMQNLYQIKRAGELVTTKVPENCSLLIKSVDGNLRGTAIATITSDELTDAAIQMTALYPPMKQLVTSGSYNVTGSDGKSEKRKVNLLNSLECYYIANGVVTRPEAISTDLFILTRQVCTLSWSDLWFSPDPEGWANVMSDKNTIGGVVVKWNQDYLLKQ